MGYRRVIQGERTVSCVPQREKSSPRGQEKQEAQVREGKHTFLLRGNKEVVSLGSEMQRMHISSLHSNGVSWNKRKRFQQLDIFGFLAKNLCIK